MQRYHMHKNGWMIESFDRHKLEEMRRLNPIYFRRARIVQVLQMKPSEVPTDTVVRMQGY